MKPTNKALIKIYKTTTIFFILLLSCSDCASPKFQNFLHGDKYNPCSDGVYHDSIECQNWKKKYPKEYRKYQERLKNSPKGM